MCVIRAPSAGEHMRYKLSLREGMESVRVTAGEKGRRSTTGFEVTAVIGLSDKMAQNDTRSYLESQETRQYCPLAMWESLSSAAGGQFIIGNVLLAAKGTGLSTSIDQL
ncbi:hypothetical protein J6590_020991 [Homalodisca vitripennis]|nr:hypothetical protein J6590_020991 [Homalodisca vitripennis]